MEGSLTADELMRRTQRAVDSVKGDMRGLDYGLAVQRLVNALRDEDAYLPPQIISRMARSMSDPWWAARHPVQAWRETRGPRGDLEGEAFKAEAAEVCERIGALSDRLGLDRLRIQSHRTIDGLSHRVEISPWSESIAQTITDAASPIRVVVSPIDR